MTRRLLSRTGLIDHGARVVAVIVSLLLVLPGVVGGPSAVHVGPILTSRITECDREYHGGDLVRTRAQIDADGPSPVLVDPGFLGFLPSCPAPNPDGNRPCTRDPSVGACATVVYVRVGADAYQGYDLAGGP